MKVIGKENVSYFSKKRNEQIEGLKLHCTSTNNHVEGLASESIWVSKNSDMYKDVASLPLNSEISCGYNRWGSVDSIQVIK